MKLIVAHSQSAVGYWDPVCACDSAGGGSAQGARALNWKKKQKNNSLKSWNEIKSLRLSLLNPIGLFANM